MCACALAEPCLTLCDPVDRTPLGSSVHGIPREGDGSELLFPSPGVLPNPGIEPASPALAGKFFTTESPGKPFPLLVNDSIFHSVNKLKVFIIFNSCTSQLRSYTDFLPPKSILN